MRARLILSLFAILFAGSSAFAESDKEAMIKEALSHRARPPLR